MFTEQHYGIQDLATLWGLGRETVRKLVMFEPGVVKLRNGKKQENTRYAIPASVAARIHARLAA
jgi:hypothetical protein